MDHHQKLAPNAKKAMEDKEAKLKVPSNDPVDDDGSLADLVGRQQPQLQREREHQAPNISEMKPVTREAYGGGMYANEEAGKKRESGRPRASATQSADGIEEPLARPRHTPPPSTGDRDLDITGMSYIQ